MDVHPLKNCIFIGIDPYPCHFPQSEVFSRQSTQGLREHRAAGSPPRLAATESRNWNGAVVNGADRKENEKPQKIALFFQKKRREKLQAWKKGRIGWLIFWKPFWKGNWESPTCAGRSVIPTCQPCPIVAGGLCTSCYIPFQDANYVTNICIHICFIHVFIYSSIYLFIYLLTYLLTHLLS